MRKADRVAARKAAAQRAQINSKEREALSAERGEYAELAQRLKRALPLALDAEKTRNYENVVQVHGTVLALAPPWRWRETGLFRSVDRHFGAFELFRVELPIPYDDYRKQRLTVYLTSAGDLAYGDSDDRGRVTVRDIHEYLDVFEKDLATRDAWLRTTPRPGQWRPDDPDQQLPEEVREELDVWRQIELRKVVEALESLGEPPGGGSADPSATP
jgi:hypothetical protein